MTLQQALLQGVDILAGAGLPDPRPSAEVLLCLALRRERIYLFSHPAYTLSTVEWIHFGRYLHQRLSGMPVQHITRTQEFYGRPFHVSPSVLIPRPETEHVVEHALAAAPNARRILDICTGSGALAITLALELHTSAVATDLSFDALLVARRNAHTLSAPVDFVHCDLAAPLHARFDLIVANPPYIPAREIDSLQREVRDHEPRIALLGGPTGTELYHRIVPQAEHLLTPGGWLVFEIGYQGEPDVRTAFSPAWSNLDTRYDLAGWPRVILARYTP
jgi:release factor glutamine methyltransferase